MNAKSPDGGVERVNNNKDTTYILTRAITEILAGNLEGGGRGW